MKRLLLLLYAMLCLAGCKEEEIDIEDSSFCNNPLPEAVDTLRILAIGNSYTQDCARYLPYIIDSAGINPKRVAVYVAAVPSACLEDWAKRCSNGEKVILERFAGQYDMRMEGTMRELLHQPWDIIVLQQYSLYTDKYNTFNPHLNILRREAQQQCTNPTVCFVWNMTWNYWTDFEYYPVSTRRYYNIVSTAQKVMARNGIDKLIPTGTAIENGRNTSLENGMGLTRDGTHLAIGTGTYIAACTWFESLFKPTFGTGIDSTRLFITIEGKHDESVRPDNYRLCQQCAIKALEHPFTVSTIEN